MTANCSPSWTSWTINTYIFLLNFSSLYPKANLYLSQCSSFSKTKKPKTTKNKICGFRRFHGLLIHNLVTPKNMEKSSQILETNPSRFKLCGSFYSSGQNWYAIHLVKETAVVRFELFWAKTKHYFFWIVHFTSFSLFYNLAALWIACLKNFPMDIRECLPYP